MWLGTTLGRFWARIFDGEPVGCACNAGVTPCTVLDPFSGAGTTGVVALRLGRDYIGIELNPEYIELTNKRLAPILAQSSLLEVTA